MRCAVRRMYNNKKEKAPTGNILLYPNPFLIWWRPATTTTRRPFLIRFLWSFITKMYYLAHFIVAWTSVSGASDIVNYTVLQFSSFFLCSTFPFACREHNVVMYCFIIVVINRWGWVDGRFVILVWLACRLVGAAMRQGTVRGMKCVKGDDLPPKKI